MPMPHRQWPTDAILLSNYFPPQTENCELTDQLPLPGLTSNARDDGGARTGPHTDRDGDPNHLREVSQTGAAIRR